MSRFPAILLTTLCLTGSLSGLSLLADKPARITPLRSDLWRMEFQKDGEDQQDLDDSAVSEDNDSRAQTERINEIVRKDGAAPSVNGPGQASPQQLRQETPIAEWRVDAAAMPETVTASGPSDWELSQAGGFKRVSNGPNVKGPSAITFAVAVVAGIVVTGAFFSGRE